MLVRNDLDLDMTRPADDFFQEDRGITEGFEGFTAALARALSSWPGELTRRMP